MEMGVERFGGEGDAECLLMGMLGGLAGQCVLVSLWVGPGPPCPRLQVLAVMCGDADTWTPARESTRATKEGRNGLGSDRAATAPLPAPPGRFKRRAF